MRRHKVLFAIILLVIVSITACKKEDESPNPEPVNRVEELNSSLENILSTTEVPGFAISIVEDENIVYQQSFGYANLESKTPYTNQTVQNMASVSKTFVGAAAAKSMELGYFDLDTDINELLPVEIVNPKQPNATIRVKHLLTHTSGLLDNVQVYLSQNYAILPGQDLSTEGARMLTDMLGISQGEAIPMEEFLAEYFLEDGDLYFSENFDNTVPGSNWSYSNSGTGLMAIIIQNVSGMPFHQFVTNHILHPLSMNSSTFHFADAMQSEPAQAYYNKSTPFPLYNNCSYAEGGLFSNNLDMGKYLQDMISGYNGNSTKLFSSQYYSLLFHDQLEAGIVPSDFGDNHGFFWVRSGGKMMHGGNSFGISTYIEITESGKSGYSLMTNLDATFDQSKFATVGPRIDEAIKLFLSK
jgi:CubicO group peptidase (beta-lactamase class C family)